MKVRRWLVSGVLFGVVWVFVRGPELAPTAVLTTGVVGVAVGLPVAYVFRRLYEPSFAVRRSTRTIGYAVLYVLAFSKEVVVANVDVAYRVLAPRMRLEPQVILIPLRVRTALGITTIANSITLTPGTVTLDHDPDENAIYVHGIDGRDPEAIVRPIRTWEDYALEVFDEELSADDPAPEITVHPPDHPPEPKRSSEYGAAEVAAASGGDGDEAGTRDADRADDADRAGDAPEEVDDGR